jgi:DNA polymerase III epsilon subunit-like protein
MGLMIVVLDTETTGLDPARHALISVGAVALDPETLEAVSEFSAYVYPREGSEWTPEAEAVNGIARCALAYEDTEEAVLPALLGWAGGRCTATVGWNLKFDLGFLCGALKRMGRHEDCPLCANPKDARDEWYRLHDGGFLTTRPKRLDDALGLIERPRSGGTHNAIEDARLTADVWRFLMGVSR